MDSTRSRLDVHKYNDISKGIWEPRVNSASLVLPAVEINKMPLILKIARISWDKITLTVWRTLVAEIYSSYQSLISLKLKEYLVRRIERNSIYSIHFTLQQAKIQKSWATILCGSNIFILLRAFTSHVVSSSKVCGRFKHP